MSLSIFFLHLYRRFAVRSSCTLNVQPTAFLFALPVPAIQSPAWFILSAFTAFATSGDALAGLSLLSILGRRSWIVSLAPSYMLFFCVSIFQRTSFVVGSGATRKNFPRLGHNVLNKMASSRIFKAQTDNCALSIVLSTINRAFRPCKTRLSSQICGKFYQIITINLNQLQTVFLPKQQQTQVAEAVTTPASCGITAYLTYY